MNSITTKLPSPDELRQNSVEEHGPQISTLSPKIDVGIDPRVMKDDPSVGNKGLTVEQQAASAEFSKKLVSLNAAMSAFPKPVAEKVLADMKAKFDSELANVQVTDPVEFARASYDSMTRRDASGMSFFLNSTNKYLEEYKASTQGSKATPPASGAAVVAPASVSQPTRTISDKEQIQTLVNRDMQAVENISVQERFEYTKQMQAKVAELIKQGNVPGNTADEKAAAALKFLSTAGANGEPSVKAQMLSAIQRDSTRDVATNAQPTSTPPATTINPSSGATAPVQATGTNTSNSQVPPQSNIDRVNDTTSTRQQSNQPPAAPAAPRSPAREESDKSIKDSVAKYAKQYGYALTPEQAKQTSDQIEEVVKHRMKGLPDDQLMKVTNDVIAESAAPNGNKGSELERFWATIGAKKIADTNDTFKLDM